MEIPASGQHLRAIRQRHVLEQLLAHMAIVALHRHVEFLEGAGLNDPDDQRAGLGKGTWRTM